MTPPKRVQRSRNTPWREHNPHAVIVDRTSKWGNPFQVVEVEHKYALVDFRGVTLAIYERKLDAQAMAVDMFRAHLTTGYANQQRQALGYSKNDVRKELSGHDLVCWCAIDEPCHADVLIDVANDTSRKPK